MTKVKICGITNLDDARLSIEAGADALGFNFFGKSPRYISPDAAQQITERLGSDVYKIGVFVNEPVENIMAIADDVNLDAVQLHGDEPREFIDDLRKRTRYELIKAVRVSQTFVPDDATNFNAHAILLDRFSATEFGGTGETFDWDLAKRVGTLIGRLWLAGGLAPENVSAAIAEVRPYGVDACSSLESVPGVKDAAKVRQFIMEAKKQ